MSDSSSGQPLFIRRVLVEKLFGRYTYDLRLQDTTDTSRLMVLYGDNGSGKTTILFLIYYLLTSIQGRGYKGYIAKTPFRRIHIEVGGDITVAAQRDGDQLIGEFRASVTRHGQTIASLLFKADKDNDITPKALGYEDEFLAFMNAVKQLNISLFYVTDDRELLSNFVPVPDEDEQLLLEMDEAGEVVRKRRRAPGLRSSKIDTALQRAIRLATDAIRQRVIKGAKQGEADVTTIYSSIVKRLASSSRPAQTLNIQSLISTLQQQAQRSAEFAQFGLPSPRNIEDLIDVLRRARNRLPVVLKVMQPYVDGINARLDALQEVQQSIFSFVGTIDSFYRDKKVEFDLEHGLTVTTSGQTLNPADLSSGEKQLLLLFCNALAARNEATIVLIDEPEISLNIKWQRQLIPSLLETSKERALQFILATHSFELFAPYESNVVQLNDAKTLAQRGTSSSNTSRTGRHLQA
jgi:energy-coupling factor transporter ATP-binding protein EcfA2